MKDPESRIVIVAFKISADLVARGDGAAKWEGISRSDFARRAYIRDVRDLEQRGRVQSEDAA